MDSNFDHQGNNNFNGGNQPQKPETPNNIENTGNTGNVDNTVNTSNTGNTGYTDNTVNTGNTGYTNNTGNADNTGYTDNTVNTDNTGYTNNTGNAGNTGYTNNTGNADNTVNTGNTGYTDNTGNTSNTGYTNSSNYGNTNGYGGSYYQSENGQNQGQPNGQNYGQSSNQDNGQNSQYGGNMQYKWNYDDYQKALKDNKSPKKKNRGFKPFIITVSSVLAVAIIGLAVFDAYNIAINRSGSAGTATTSGNINGTTLNITSQPTTSSTTATSGTEMTAVQVAAKLTPSVVGVEIYSLTSVEPTAEGTGIIMSTDGYIVTNAHVISGAQKICIVMSSGKKYDTVKTVGQDTKSDLAVLKIEATGLTAATFGDSSQLKVGQAVLAIGNPGGLTFADTVTNGIISGLNRTVSSSTSGTQMSYIQTNALINPGNSGGPLVNMYGQVVGINSAKITATGYEGIGFSIPINTAKPFVDSIIKNGYVTGRVKVGVSVYSLSNSQAKWYSYPSGLYVESIEQTSDAYKQGIRTKDIITQINGITLANDDSSTVYNTFYKEETKYKAGETVTVKVYRTETGSSMTFKVKLEEDKGDSAETTTTSSATEDQSGSGSTSSDSSDFWSQFGQ